MSQYAYLRSRVLLVRKEFTSHMSALPPKCLSLQAAALIKSFPPVWQVHLHGCCHTEIDSMTDLADVEFVYVCANSILTCLCRSV